MGADAAEGEGCGNVVESTIRCCCKPCNNHVPTGTAHVYRALVLRNEGCEALVNLPSDPRRPRRRESYSVSIQSCVSPFEELIITDTE
jgi:hypothetical protein